VEEKGTIRIPQVRWIDEVEENLKIIGNTKLACCG
jgi:hypothetical protein